MEKSKVPSEKFLKIKYGPIYNLLFTTVIPIRSRKELLRRNGHIIRYLTENPSKIFKTRNSDTINEFTDIYNSYKKYYTQEEIQKYESVKKDMEIRKGGIMSKPAILKIIQNISIIDCMNLYKADPEIKNLIDNSNVWGTYLKSLNNQDTTNYQKLLNINKVEETVMTVMGIKRMVRIRKEFNKYWKPLSKKPSYTIKQIYNEPVLFPDILDYKGSKTIAGLLPYLVNLKVLHLNFLGMGNTIPNIFKRLVNLNKLTVGGKNIKIIPNGIFQPLCQLKYISIIYTSIKTLPEKIFTGLYDLKRINLSHNELTTVSSNIFEGLDNLEMVDLSHNNIKKLSKKLTERLYKLQKVTLSDNKIKERWKGGTFECSRY